MNTTTAALAIQGSSRRHGWLYGVIVLTKPGITLFIALSAAAGFILAAGSWREGTLLVSTVVATALLSAGAAAFNQLIESKLDRRMLRTSTRPVAGGLISRIEAGAIAAALCTAGLAVALTELPDSTTVLLLGSLISYVGVYTPLKTRTPACTLVGGIPGSLPVVAGWLAAGGAVDPAVFALSGILFTWQMPHFLAIGWRCRDDYARAGFRVLPALDPDGGATGRCALAFSVALLLIAPLPTLLGLAGPFYLGCALLLGFWFIRQAYRFARERSDGNALRLFLASLLYLPALLATMVLDRLW